jgi:hypothetical protein
LVPLIAERAEILALVACVKPIDSTKPQLTDVNILNLEDKMVSLYQRIEQACLFAQSVENTAKHIESRLADLMTDVDTDSASLEHFPKNLYKNTLRTIGNILDGALNESNNTETARREQQAGTDTLLHYLRKLDLGKAQEKLNILATEVGLSPTSLQQQPFLEIQGNILSSYRNCKTLFEKVVDNLNKQSNRTEELIRQLASVQPESPFQDDINKLQELKTKLNIIEDAMQDIPNDAESKRQNLQTALRNGQFSVLQSIPEDLLRPARGQLTPIQAELDKIENHLTQEKRERTEELANYLSKFSPLFKSQHEQMSVRSELANNELTINEFQLLCDTTLKSCQDKAQTILAGTGLTLADWQQIYEDLNTNQMPNLTREQQQALVDKGILKMRLMFAVD